MLKAMQAVIANGGAAGVDGMEVVEVRGYLLKHWAGLKEQILNGSYESRPVRRVDIPKPGGGTRMLGIATVTDRLIQQAIHQILSPYGSLSSHRAATGFGPEAMRPRRSKPLKATSTPASAGWWTWTFEKFFDRVNHDVLMARVARRVKDRRMLKLIRRYLQSGINSR
jgi:RNA-directed DNA polymerase